MRRTLLALSVLLLSACGDGGGDKSGMSTNIVDEGASYDVGNITPSPDDMAAGDEEGAAPNASRPQERPNPPSRSATAADGPIPSSVQGRWTGVNDVCGDRSADLELTIAPSSLSFYESVGTATAVSSGPGGRLRVDAAFTGEGDSWTRKIELRPSANGRELTVINDGAAVTRKRC